MTRADTVPALNIRTHTCNRGTKSQLSLRGRQRCADAKKDAEVKSRERALRHLRAREAPRTHPPPFRISRESTPLLLFFSKDKTKQKTTLISSKEILTESPWPPCWVWRQMLWRSAGAGHWDDSRHDRSGEAWDARLIFSRVSCFYGWARGVAAKGFSSQHAWDTRPWTPSAFPVRVSNEDTVRFSCRRVRGMNIFTDSVKGEM